MKLIAAAVVVVVVVGCFWVSFGGYMGVGDIVDLLAACLGHTAASLVCS